MNCKNHQPAVLLACICFLGLSGCLKDKGPYTVGTDATIEKSGYPLDVAKIIINKCATAGCHNTQSKEASSGLDLSTWDNMFKGNHSGSVTIAYRSDASPLFTFCNTFSDLGDTTQLPKMPVNAAALTKAEVQTLQNWINAGARDKNGNEKFTQVAGRRKYYVSNQGCDNVSVFDAQTRLVMRLVDVGHSGLIESPHMIKVAPDGAYWYAVFVGGDVIQKFSTTNDSMVGELSLGGGLWSAITISQDGTTGWVTDWQSNGRVACVDLGNMTLKQMYQGSQLFVFPHGLALDDATHTLYVTGQTGNFIYKIDVSDPANPDVSLPMSLQPGIGVNYNNSLNPHEISIAPGDTTYFVTCEWSNELRAYRKSDDSLLASFSGFYNCKEMTYSLTNHLLFVSCIDDSVTFAPQHGSVGVIDFSTLTYIKHINSGYQPHGIAVDDQQNMVYVANINSNGTAPHHKSLCGGKNGNVTIIDMSTLDLVPGYKHEVSVFPYSVTLRN